MMCVDCDEATGSLQASFDGKNFPYPLCWACARLEAKSDKKTTFLSGLWYRRIGQEFKIKIF